MFNTVLDVLLDVLTVQIAAADGDEKARSKAIDDAIANIRKASDRIDQLLYEDGKPEGSEGSSDG